MKTVFCFACALFLAAQADAKPPVTSTGTVTSVQRPAKQAKRAFAPVRAQAVNETPAGGEQPSFAPRASKGQGPAKLLASGADQSVEESAVMVDARSDEDPSGRFPGGESDAVEESEDAPVPGGMPASYGQLKGALNDGGRSLLVFENEDGVISFVQLIAGKSAVSWKLVSKIYRSED